MFCYHDLPLPSQIAAWKVERILLLGAGLIQGRSIRYSVPLQSGCIALSLFSDTAGMRRHLVDHRKFLCYITSDNIANCPRL